MKEIIEEYDAPYFGIGLVHGDRIEGYTVRKFSNGDYEIYVQMGNRMTGGAFTISLHEEEMAGKSYEEVVELLPLSNQINEVLLNDEELKLFLGFGEEGDLSC